MGRDREKLDSASVGAYLRAHDVLPAESEVLARTLGGGVSNVVLEVRTDEDCLVVKQPLSNLAVEDDWPVDLARVHAEAEAARTYNRLLSENPGLDVRVPRVEFEHDGDHVIAMECAPAGHQTWKSTLLSGTVDEAVASRLGRFLARSHSWTADRPALRDAFTHDELFDQLRLDPYHRTVAERHEDVSNTITEEISRLKDEKRTLVHGDYSPKNVLVDPVDPTEPIWLLDFEVASWGDPAFDVAFMLNHLFIKAIYVDSVGRGRSSAFREAAMSFWETYRSRVEWDLEGDVVSELGVLMLARVDGKSPVEYVTDAETKATLRTTAKRSLTEPVTTVEAFSSLLADVYAR